MSTFKCKMCGGALEIKENESTATCEYCGSTQTLPKYNDEKLLRLSDRANHFRLNREYDKASKIYEQILEEDDTDAETYWALVLCRYGIVYVEDPASLKRMPTINRMQYTSIFDDENYKLAIEKADFFQKHIYEQEADTINKIQKSILEISKKEAPYDIFICYKENDEMGNRTRDSVYANEIYNNLEKEGYRVFFARISLENALGEAYEPIIFAALNSAKVMIAIGSKPEYFNAVWVKNEWSRFLSLIKNGANKQLIPAYFDMDAYNLPEEFSHLQALDLSKIGYIHDLTRGIEKILTKQAPQKKEVSIVDNYITRIELFLQEKDFKSAKEYCEKILDIDAQNYYAYLYRLLSALGLQKIEDLANVSSDYSSHPDYKHAVSFANSEQLQNLIDICDKQFRKTKVDLLHKIYKAKETVEKDNYLVIKKQFNFFVENEFSKIDKLEYDISTGGQNAIDFAAKTTKLEEMKKNVLAQKEATEKAYSSSIKKARIYNKIINYASIPAIFILLLIMYIGFGFENNTPAIALLFSSAVICLVASTALKSFYLTPFKSIHKNNFYEDLPNWWSDKGGAKLIRFVKTFLLLIFSLGLYYNSVLKNIKDLAKEKFTKPYDEDINQLEKELKNNENHYTQITESLKPELEAKLQQAKEDLDGKIYRATQMLASFAIKQLAKFKDLSNKLSQRLTNVDNESKDGLLQELKTIKTFEPIRATISKQIASVGLVCKFPNGREGLIRSNAPYSVKVGTPVDVIVTKMSNQGIECKIYDKNYIIYQSAINKPNPFNSIV